MAKYHDRAATKSLGKNFKRLRVAAGFSIEDIVAMTGFQRNTIVGIESGSNAAISYIIAYALSLGIHPKEVLDIPLDIKPRYALPPNRKEKGKLTLETIRLIESGFFESPRTNREVCERLKQSYPEALNLNESALATILKRQVDEGNLERSGPKNRYSYRQKKKK